LIVSLAMQCAKKDDNYEESCSLTTATTKEIVILALN